MPQRGRLASDAGESYLAHVASLEVTMLPVALWFGLFWSQIAPMIIVPGMTKEQVEAILGKERVGTFIFSGSVNSDGPDYETCTYRGGTLTVHYKRGKVEVVGHHRK